MACTLQPHEDTFIHDISLKQWYRALLSYYFLLFLFFIIGLSIYIYIYCFFLWEVSTSILLSRLLKKNHVLNIKVELDFIYFHFLFRLLFVLLDLIFSCSNIRPLNKFKSAQCEHGGFTRFDDISCGIICSVLLFLPSRR